MTLFSEKDHDELSRLFGDPCPRWCAGDRNSGGCATRVKGYSGYKPDAREAPNGDGNVDAGPAGKRYLHVADKYGPPAWARAYQDRAYAEACRVAEALAVPKAFWPMPSAGALRVLEYPSAGHVGGSGEECHECGAFDLSGVCPALAAGAGTAEHTDFDLFTIVLWRSTPDDLECTLHAGKWSKHLHDGKLTRFSDAGALSPNLHIGEIGELVGLGPATPHRVPARPYVQKSIVYFAIPDHAARLPLRALPDDVPPSEATRPTVGAWLAERMARSRVYT